MKYTSLLVLMLVLLPPFGLFSDAEEKPPVKETAPPPATESRSSEAMKEKRVVVAVDADGVQRVEVLGGSYYFDPNYIVVKVNVPVELKVRKGSGYVPHDIVVKAPEAGINFSESLGSEPRTIKFTPTAVGKYLMYCSKKLPFVKSHHDRGMEGMIEVVQ